MCGWELIVGQPFLLRCCWSLTPSFYVQRVHISKLTLSLYGLSFKIRRGKLTLRPKLTLQIRYLTSPDFLFKCYGAVLGFFSVSVGAGRLLCEVLLLD